MDASISRISYVQDKERPQLILINIHTDILQDKV